MKQKIQALLSEMNTGLIDREHAIKAAVLTVLAAENLVLIGPPGTAKSMVSRRVAQHIQTTNSSHQPDDGSGSSYFEYLLTKFSTPEEIFGPLSISELKADRFRRNTAGYLPTAEIAFLDEIFKSSSSILNSLLTILNERIFHNGNQPQPVPLRSLISASNELPNGQEELSALYDRFLIRTFVGPVREEHLHLLFDAPGPEKSPDKKPDNTLSADNFQAVDAAVQQVRMPPEVGESIRSIWAAHKEAFKEDRREYLSDRRLVKLIKLLRVSAATNNRTEVDLSDVMLLQHCLWNHPDNMAKVREIVITTLQKFSAMVPVDGEDSDRTEEVYVLGGDGRQLVQQPRQMQQATTNTGSQLAVPSGSRQVAASGNALSVSPMRALPPTKTRTKGFMGSGTAQDPIRIGNAEDLISLDDPDIGLVGYHFVQTDDIDCAAITHWPSFAFKGHYDGNGQSIRNVGSTDKSTAASVFSKLLPVQGTSSVVHLQLEGCSLANVAVHTSIEHCRANGSSLLGQTSNSQLIDCQISDGSLVKGDVHDTQISSCRVMGRWDSWLVGGNCNSSQITDCQVMNWGLVQGRAESSQITSCQVLDGVALVLGQALGTSISDCAVIATQSITTINGFTVSGVTGLIAKTLENGSAVERCFVGGYFRPDVYFGGITGSCKSSTIRQCAVGSLNLSLPSSNQSRRIAYKHSSATLLNNASIDTNPGQDDPNGPDGKTVAAARFNQRFFEGSLGWDFDTVWEWDTANNRPSLRFGANAPQGTGQSAANGTPLQDLLTHQVQANIWL